MRRHLVITLAVGLAMLAASLLAYHWSQMPTTLRIAVGPMGSEDTRLVAAAAQHLTRERQSVRLKLVLTEGVAASAQAIDDDKVDLAVVRSDVALPLKAPTIAILHRDIALLMTLPNSGISQVSGLWGRNVGIIRNQNANRLLFETALEQYGIPKTSVTTIMLNTPGEVEEGLRTKRIDAVLAVGSVTGHTVTEAVAAVAAAAEGGAPVFIPLTEADAIAQRLPAFEELEVVRGSFGGAPPRPPDRLETLGITHRLVAQDRLDENVVAELTRLIFAIRPALATEVPLAHRIEAPETEKGSSLPLHPGAAAYYEGEVRSFFERYGDWFYLLIMALSILGSGAAGLASSAANQARARNMALLSELLAIVRDAHHAEPEELERLDRKADEILAQALAKAGSGGIDNAGVAAFTLGLDQARRAIAERRRILVARGTTLAEAAE